MNYRITAFFFPAKVKIAVDGGTTRWFDYIHDKTGLSPPHKSENYLPDLVTGDFDSIDPITLQNLKNTRVEVIHTPDQNETDYTKAMLQLRDYCDKKNIYVGNFAAKPLVLNN